MTLGPEGQVSPGLATSVSTPNPVTYVYHLRHGVTFWDGDEMTSADVVYSLNYVRSPGSQDAYAFDGVKSIQAAGPYTVVVTLTQPDASWQFLPAQTTAEIFEKKFALAHPGTFGNPGVLVMGTGPWEIESFDPTTGAEYIANPHWWGGPVTIQHISFKIFSNETSLALAMRAGEVDVDPAVSDAQSFAATSGAKLLTAVSCSESMFAMNTQSAPWSNVDVRRAVAYAVDRTDIIKGNGGFASPTYTLKPTQLLQSIASPAQIAVLLRSLPLYQYNLAKAKAEMAESPYPHGFSLNLPEPPSYVQVAEVIAAELQSIGIRLRVQSFPLTTWLSMVTTAPASSRPATYTGAGCTTPDPSDFDDLLGAQNLEKNEYNVAAYAPAAFDKLLVEGAAITDPAERFAIYSKIYRQLATDEPYVPLFLNDSVAAISSKFTWLNYGQWSDAEDWALNIRPAA